MKVLVVGSGGREHALVWQLKQNPEVETVYCAPGNAGISADAECVPIGVGELEKLADFAAEHAVDLTVVGPEAPLCDAVAPPTFVPREPDPNRCMADNVH